MSCFTFIVFFRDYFFLAIDLITKHYECSLYFLIISLFFYVYFVGIRQSLTLSIPKIF
jgi:hypothetical protein